MLLLFLLFSLFSTISSIPVSGNHPWTVLLCKFVDVEWEPQSREWFMRWITDANAEGSLANYFRVASNEQYTIFGTEVHGWYSIPYTYRQVERLALLDPNLTNDPSKQRELLPFYKIKQLCTARALELNFQVRTPSVITVINAGNTAMYCHEEGILLTPQYLMTAALAHEMVHSFSIGHSYSTSFGRVFPHASPGEYDDRYDLMSTSNAYMHKPDGNNFGLTGPGLNGPHLDYLGWLPATRIYYFGRGGERDITLRLSPLSLPHVLTNDILLVSLPYDRDDPRLVYTLEYRVARGLDKGVGTGGVVLHRIERRNNHYFSVLIKQGDFYEMSVNDTWRHKIVGFSGQSIAIHVLSKWENAVDIHVSSTFEPDACSDDEVPRRTNADDNVCVTKNEMDVSTGIKRQQFRRQVSSKMCVIGFVRREATAHDRMCLTSGELMKYTRQSVRHSRRLGFWSTRTFGLNSCKAGLRWRMISRYDYVCVTDAHQQDVRQQNDANSRRSDFNGVCLPGFVQRQALIDDPICVTAAEKRKTTRDYERLPETLEVYEFFNGVDNVFMTSNG